MTGPPARRPVDDALDRLDAALLRWAQSEWHEDYPAAVAALATVREALERQRDDNGRLVQVMDGMARESDLEHQSERRAYWRKRAEAAEAEVRRLNVDLENEAVAYERAREDVRRLTEGLRETLRAVEKDPEDLLLDVGVKTRALLSASPSDGVGA